MTDEAKTPVKRRGWSYLLVPLAPPIVWFVYFMIVYLYAEAGCALAWDRPSWFGLHGVAVVTVFLTIATLASIAYYTWSSWQGFHRPDDHPEIQLSRSLGLLGLVLGLIFIPATIGVGLFAVLVPAC